MVTNHDVERHGDGGTIFVNRQTLSSPTLTVVEQISEKEGVDSVDLRPPLHDVVDTEALDRIIESMDGDGLVEFQYQGYQVTVSNTGEVEVQEKARV
ncbi:hypothetical protein OB919_16145 [Halobacteria archaeon AArc-curdl1]|uniref:Halobacterial output domain-containing protein n=1 Tax=Natronosalvus hydrolyticus TaxID=2979988 RepID=A0AAP2ZA40_9EURY|nr:hypothetical protein [Halobacteria archaeon AArc-curdl1]